MFQLSYINEDDRAFGLAGMAISLASLDALDRVTEVFLDADGPMVSFRNNYYFSLSPSVSPKAVWNNLLRNFHLTASMAMGNIMARTLIRLGEEPDQEVFNSVREIMREEGRETCELDEEESDIIFDNVWRQNKRLFHNPMLHPAIKELAGVIARRRRLSSPELIEELRLLRL